MPESPRRRVWIDRGGTFTDAVLFEPSNGHAKAVKVLSSDDAPLEAIRALLGLEADAPIPPCDLRMGTTIATNALLERRGARMALVTNKGFGDLLEVGYQNRRELFALRIEKPAVLYEAVVEVDGRMDARGGVVTPLDLEAVRPALAQLRDSGVAALAIALIHAHVDGSMEQALAALGRELGFIEVSCSHEVSAEEGLVGRGDTTLADAYLTPALRSYVDTLREALPGSHVAVMQSSGGLCDGRRFRGRDAILSGPAGGAVAVQRVAEQLGGGPVIGFDMGGTSTDVCRCAGALEHTYETEVAGVRFRAPMVRIHTVAAGGGSLCRVESGRFIVGPESAGASPGPLCYGDPSAHELALTDVALVLGRVQPFHFPFEIELSRAEAGLDSHVAALAKEGIAWSRDQVAEGFLRVAVSNMAAAIREVSLARGYDVREHALVVFGGAGGQYACAIARELGIRSIHLHPLAGVLSAYGMGVAAPSVHLEAELGARPLEAGAELGAEAVYASLEARALEALRGDGIASDTVESSRRVSLRYAGTQTALTIELGDANADALRRRFEAAHRRAFGYAREGYPIEVLTARVELLAEGGRRRVVALDRGAAPKAHPSEAALVLEGARRHVPVWSRGELRVGQRIEGPALLLDDTGTIVVEPGFSMTLRADGIISLVDDAAPAPERMGLEADPVTLEVMKNLFMSVAEQMGQVLRRTAISTNIRDRYDFSCAIFDHAGGLVANAPHIPVHLGAMSESVKAVLAAHPRMAPGDAFVTNDPAHGGSHLPDITVVSPVHGEGGALLYFVACRGHHADIGGITPGSMPPASRSLVEEGVVFSVDKFVSDGHFDEEGFRRRLTEAAYPARRPDENVADLEAHLAANRLGASLLEELGARYGHDAVSAYMGHVQSSASAAVREAIAALPDGVARFEDALDDGTPIVVELEVDGDRLKVDFGGTAPAVEGNSNAPRAVTVAAVLYVLRTLVGKPIPLNGGCLEPIELLIPEGSLLDPPPGRAVAAGNVETSQRVVDVLLGALGIAAASQGTMNNLTFGDAQFGYYETIGGGAGALPDADGASGVHTHMTNSRITDPEILEARYPVRLRRFGLRRGSGGQGAHRGGDGLVREIELLAPLDVGLLSERRVRPPFGLEGGEPGALGRNLLDGELLGGRATVHAPAGAVLRIETPGGGGYGRAPHAR